ncbi:bifunctional 4-hydroxy-2-oxoglutarate aldolase/2-dehydro-3-deoxy-phosphogluconate aldolase [uncultured Arthrobacter sp.]|uniref:bifunctional 4-hydroxy-2-oxoglutarate aldolase/2-dehydro-3-deoxy-phosphogluconate aldolase n=1 Tax=uncultured Arthrobacter sp. TaxID=114050 RepID=UPI00345C2CC7
MGSVLNSEFFVPHLSSSPTVAILRGLTVEDTVERAEQCWSQGIRLVEVPLQSEEAFLALQAAARSSNSSDRLIGAGTICTPRDVDRAQEAGAQFLVSPGFFPSSIAHARELNIPILPGVTTPTEIHGALSMSLNVQKLFPADMVGPSALKTLRGPFPNVHFVAVGGITPSNADEFLQAGALGVGVGNALTDPAALGFFARLNNTQPARKQKDNG